MSSKGNAVEQVRSVPLTTGDITSATTAAFSGTNADGRTVSQLDRYQTHTFYIKYVPASPAVTAVVRIEVSGGSGYGSALQAAPFSPTVTGGDITLPAAAITVPVTVQGTFTNARLRVVTYTSGTISATLRSVG